MKHEEFLSKYCRKLNTEQLTAVQSTEGPTLLLAVPGSGKTTVLVTRLGYMLYVKGISPDNILTVTYTTAATSDMKNRFQKLFQQEAANYSDRLEFRTINGICVKILEYYCQRYGKTMHSLLSEDQDAMLIFRDIYLRHNNDYPTESDLSEMRTLITYCKNMCLTEEEIQQLGEKEKVKLLEYYKDYDNVLKTNKLMDYDDQLKNAYVVLKKLPDVLAYFRNKYRYLCVDESQDTSKIQHLIIQLLAGPDGNLFMVGDEDQSIYGFRAAYPEALLDFEKTYRNATTLVMSTNYRSGKRIVEAADHFICHNKLRHQKKMVASREDEANITLIDLKTRQEQYAHLLEVARNISLPQTSASAINTTAVLYRENESIIPLVDLLDREGIPYRIKGSYGVFFSNRVVQDITSILRFALDPTSTEDFRRIYPKLSLYLNKQQAQQLCLMAELNERSIFDILDEVEELDYGKRKTLREFRDNLRTVAGSTPSNALSFICGRMGYSKYVHDNELDDGRLFVLKELARKEQKISLFLARLDYLQTRLDNETPDYDARFILSTIHLSKGLEYDQVYLLDVGDSIFPKKVAAAAKPQDSKEYHDFEEERRIFYVGITRARNQLNLFRIKNIHSRFIDEMMLPVQKNTGSEENNQPKPRARIKLKATPKSLWIFN